VSFLCHLRISTRVIYKCCHRGKIILFTTATDIADTHKQTNKAINQRQSRPANNLNKLRNYIPNTLKNADSYREDL